MIAYTTECFLVTVAAILRIFSRAFDNHHRSRPILTACQKSYSIFISTVIFFELSLAISALASLPYLNSFYQSLITEHAVVFASFALISTFLLKDNPLSIEPINQWLLAIVFAVFTAVLEFIIRSLLRHGPEVYGDGACAIVPNMSMSPKIWGLTLQTVPAAIIFRAIWAWITPRIDPLKTRRKKFRNFISDCCFWIWMLASRTRRNRPMRRNRGDWDQIPHLHFKKLIFAVILVFAIVLMWGVVAFMWVIRSNMQGSAGPSWTENTWGFGQILAMLVWAPVILSFMIILGTSHPINSLAQVFDAR